MLKVKSRLFAVSLVFCLILALPVFLNSSIPVSGAETNAAAGSADDPLVTLSYINKVLKPSLEESVLKAANQAIADKLKDFTVSAPSNQQNTYILSEGASSSYLTLELAKGQRLRVKEGSLELILRPGSSAVVISNFQTQGIADLTTGDELLNGDNLPINHSLLIPRNDGRGISITSVIAYVMVRGDYEIY